MMFDWKNGWIPFDDDIYRLYLERELVWKLSGNDRHLLAGRQFIAVGWIRGYDDLILKLDGGGEFAWVHLSWNAENRPQWPHCELLSDIESVNRFMSKWERTNGKDEV